MSKENSRPIISIMIILLIALGLVLAGSQGGYHVSGVPVYGICVAIAFIIQWLTFIPAYLYHTEKFYDLAGSLTYITVLGLAVVMTPEVDARSYLLAGITSIWAVRLGIFLFLRIRTIGEDRRFREIKKSFPRFLLAWTLQGLWISFSLAAALATITSTLKLELELYAALGTFLWLTGFLIEIIADKQKSNFNAIPRNKGKFIQTGLWAWSRHPNYFGEIVLWVGVAVIAFPVLRGWQWVTLLSPLFITILLTRISGIPTLEEHADKKWGRQDEYETYKARTSILIPFPPIRKDNRQ